VLQCDNPFWSFSLAVYGAPGVAAECLALQDTRGADVNVLLFCAWLGVSGRVLSAEDFAAIEAAVQPWRERVITPLRATRRDLKTIPDAADQTVAALRKDVAALERRAEQAEQAMLCQLLPTLSVADAAMAAEAVRHNISRYLDDKASAPLLIQAALAHASRE